jgi:hypothetical protein
MAVAAGKKFTTAVKDRHAPATSPTLGVHLTTKPRSPPAKGARCPHDRDALRYGLSVLASPIPRPKHYYDAVDFRKNPDPFCRLPHPGQRMQEALSSAQQAFAMPTADVDRHAAFDGPPGHQALGNMRGLGVGSLDVSCWQCHHWVILSADPWSDDVPVPTFGPRMVCTRCGIIGADARLNWQEAPPRETLTGRAMAMTTPSRKPQVSSAGRSTCSPAARVDAPRSAASERLQDLSARRAHACRARRRQP